MTDSLLSDSPEVLCNWLDRFGGHATWTDAAPRVEDVDSLATFLRGIAANPDKHTSQVFLFDRDARLAYRMVELPRQGVIAGAAKYLPR